jgi:hypothetical protein
MVFIDPRYLDDYKSNIRYRDDYYLDCALETQLVLLAGSFFCCGGYILHNCFISIFGYAGELNSNSNRVVKGGNVFNYR